MYVVAVNYKGEDEKAVLNGPFEARNLAEQAVVNLVARNDVRSATVLDEEELEEKDNENG